MKQVSLVVVIALIFFGCRKFNHEAKLPQDCPRCAEADALEGTYRGYLSGILTLLSTSTINDSITIGVKHVFKNLGPAADSTRMFLEMRFKYDSRNDTMVRVYELKSDGSINAFYRFNISVDSIKIHDRIVPQFGAPINFYYTGYRIP